MFPAVLVLTGSLPLGEPAAPIRNCSGGSVSQGPPVGGTAGPCDAGRFLDSHDT